nr:MFS transporter [Halomarina oriensis]
MALSTLGFLIPVWVVLLDDARGFTYTQISVLDVVFFGTILVAELPTGYLGDRIGRRNALAISSVAIGLAATAFGVAESFESFLVVYVVWGVAQTFRTGNDSAWLYDALVRYGEPESFTRVRGRGLAVFLATNAVTSVAGGYLYAMDPTYPFYATGVVNVLGGVVVATLPEAVVDDADRFTLREARVALSRLAAPSLRGFLVYAALFYAVGWSVDLFVQPISLDAGLDAVELGYLYALLVGASALASNYAGVLAERVGVARLLHGAPVVLGVAFVVLGLSPLAAVPVFLLMRVLLNVTTPVAEGYLNDRTPSLGRATVLSAFSMAVSLASIPVKLASGPLADATTLFVTIGALGVLLLVGSAVVFAVGRPVEDGVPARVVESD